MTIRIVAKKPPVALAATGIGRRPLPKKLISLISSDKYYPRKTALHALVSP